MVHNISPILEIPTSQNKRSNFSGKNAHVLSILANLAYNDDNNIINNAGKNYGFTKTFIIDRPYKLGSENGFKCFVWTDDKKIIVSFRGTHSLSNWMTDLSFVTEKERTPSWYSSTKYEGQEPQSHVFKNSIKGRVHSGFLSATNMLLQDLQQADGTTQKGLIKLLEELFEQKPDRALFLTGHSLGGAMATLPAARLTPQYAAKTFIYSYGSPQCGTRDFASSFDRTHKSQYFRIVNNRDPITGFLALAGYVHVGQRFFYNGTTLHQNISQPLWFLYRIGNSISALLSPALTLLYALASSITNPSDHFLSGYTTRLEKDFDTSGVSLLDAQQTHAIAALKNDNKALRAKCEELDKLLTNLSGGFVEQYTNRVQNGAAAMPPAPQGAGGVGL